MLSWFKGKTPRNYDESMACKDFPRALEFARAEIQEQPRDLTLRLRLADALAGAGQTAEAITVLEQLADVHATQGHMAKGISLLKKVQRLDPARANIDRKLACYASLSGNESMAERLRRMREAEGAPPLRPRIPASLPEEEKTPEPSIATATPVVPVTPVPEPVPDMSEPIPDLEDSELIGIGEPTSIVDSPLFSDFSEEELIAVTRGLTLESYEAGQIIMTEGEIGDSLLIVTDGMVRVHVRDTRGANKEVRQMGEGAFFGEISILSGNPRTATVTAGARSELLRLDRATLDDICDQQPRVRQVLLEFYAKRIASAEEEEIRKS